MIAVAPTAIPNTKTSNGSNHETIDEIVGVVVERISGKFGIGMFFIFPAR